MANITILLKYSSEDGIESSSSISEPETEFDPKRERVIGDSSIPVGEIKLDTKCGRLIKFVIGDSSEDEKESSSSVDEHKVKLVSLCERVIVGKPLPTMSRKSKHERLKKVKVRNPCKICGVAVSTRNGLKCSGACKKWAHFCCLKFSPALVQNIQNGNIKIKCPCACCQIDAEQLSPVGSVKSKGPVPKKFNCNECKENKKSVKKISKRFSNKTTSFEGSKYCPSSISIDGCPPSLKNTPAISIPTPSMMHGEKPMDPHPSLRNCVHNCQSARQKSGLSRKTTPPPLNKNSDSNIKCKTPSLSMMPGVPSTYHSQPNKSKSHKKRRSRSSSVTFSSDESQSATQGGALRKKTTPFHDKNASRRHFQSDASTSHENSMYRRSLSIIFCRSGCVSRFSESEIDPAHLEMLKTLEKCTVCGFDPSENIPARLHIKLVKPGTLASFLKHGIQLTCCGNSTTQCCRKNLEEMKQMKYVASTPCYALKQSNCQLAAKPLHFPGETICKLSSKSATYVRGYSCSRAQLPNPLEQILYQTAGRVAKNCGLQCKGACETWIHYKCLNYTPGKISDIKKGLIQVACPCPDCKTTAAKEFLTNEPFACNNIRCPANHPPACTSPECQANDLKGQPIPPAPPGTLKSCGKSCIDYSNLDEITRDDSGCLEGYVFDKRGDQPPETKAPREVKKKKVNKNTCSLEPAQLMLVEKMMDTIRDLAGQITELRRQVIILSSQQESSTKCKSGSSLHSSRSSCTGKCRNFAVNVATNSEERLDHLKNSVCLSTAYESETDIPTAYESDLYNM